MADIFDEVSEELRQDQILKLWKRYAKHIISFVILIVVTLISYKSYIVWNEKQLSIKSQSFFDAIEKLDNKDYKSSTKYFSKNLSEKYSGYKMLSLFGLAHSNFENNKNKEMILNYKSIYEDKNIDSYYRQLARLLSVIKDNSSSFEQLKNRLKPILNSPSKLQALAAELEIMVHIRFNKKKMALDMINLLLNRKDITLNQKNRLILIKKVYDSNV